jgi:hypothetical protein
MKLHQVAKGTRAVKPVLLRFANAPVVDGPDWENDENTVIVGVRVLTGTEISEALQKAQESVAQAGVPQWLATHPLCRLHEMAQTVAVGCVDNEAHGEPFFIGGFDQVMSSPEIAGANIAYLFEQIEAWNEEVNGRSRKFTGPQIIAAMVAEAERPENAQETFFSRLSPASRERFLHSTAVMFTDVLTSRSLIGSPDATATTTPPPSPTSEEPAAPAPRARRKGKR